LAVWETSANYPILGKIAVCIESSDFERNTAPIGSVERKMRRSYGWRCYLRVTPPAVDGIPHRLAALQAGAEVLGAAETLR
jgi:hypothetical protein